MFTMENVIEAIQPLKTQEKMLDALEEDDDVQDVFHNSEFPEEFEG